MKIQFLEESEIRAIVFNELKRKDKLISKEQLRALIKIEVNKHLNKIVYQDLDKLRTRINEIERRLEI